MSIKHVDNFYHARVNINSRVDGERTLKHCHNMPHAHPLTSGSFM